MTSSTTPAPGAHSAARRRTLKQCALALLGLGLAGTAWAVDFGPLTLQTNDRGAVGEIVLSERLPLDMNSLRVRIAAPQAFSVAGLTYLPAFQNARVSTQTAPNGRVVVRIDTLPTTPTEYDLLIMVGDRMTLALSEYHIDLRGAARSFAAAPAGARMASTKPRTVPETRAAAQAQAIPAAPKVASPAESSKLAQANPPAPAPAPAPSPAAPTAHATAPKSPAADTDQARAQAQASSGAEAVSGKTVVSPALADARLAVENWAQAWTQRDLSRYVGAYTHDYQGKLASHAAWVAQRKERISGRADISVTLEDLRLEQRKAVVIARFVQHYRSGPLKESSRKRLELVFEGERWLIKRETERP